MTQLPHFKNEKRKSARREILDFFSFYVCIPALGLARHQVRDVSEMGIGFVVETLGEFKLKKNFGYDLHFYLNQSLYLPLKVEVIRDENTASQQLVGAVFLETASAAHQTYNTLVQFIGQLTQSVVKKT